MNSILQVSQNFTWRRKLSQVFGRPIERMEEIDRLRTCSVALLVEAYFSAYFRFQIAQRVHFCCYGVLANRFINFDRFECIQMHVIMSLLMVFQAMQYCILSRTKGLVPISHRAEMAGRPLTDFINKALITIDCAIFAWNSGNMTNPTLCNCQTSNDPSCPMNTFVTGATPYTGWSGNFPKLPLSCCGLCVTN